MCKIPNKKLLGIISNNISETDDLRANIFVRFDKASEPMCIGWLVIRRFATLELFWAVAVI